MINDLSVDFDVVVIGGGSAGYAAARTVAAGGLKTAIIDGAPELGGLCILRGCMPAKALLFSSEILHYARNAAVYGIKVNDAMPDFQAVMARKNRLIADFASYRVGQLESDRFTLFRSQARFLDPHTVALPDGRRIRSKSFVIATGSVVSTPPYPDLAEVGYWTSDEALEAKSLPKSLIILGGGAVALEFAQFYQRMGTQVALVQRSGQVLKDEDTDTAEAIQKTLKREGVDLYTGTKVTRISREGGLKVVEFNSESGPVRVFGEEILYALGRVPNVHSLSLENAGVRLNADGAIDVDKLARTSAAHIFAAGDCVGLHDVVHVAIQQAEIAGHNILFPHKPRSYDSRLAMNIVFTDPQIATVGLTEKAAKAQGVPHISASYLFNDHGKSMIMETMEGFVKLLADPASGEILGGTCVGPVGGELIHEVVVAMAARMTAREFASVPHYHPTLAEIWTYPAEELADQIPG